MLIPFPSQQWLHEGALLLLCTYTACIVIFLENWEISVQISQHM